MGTEFYSFLGSNGFRKTKNCHNQSMFWTAYRAPKFYSINHIIKISESKNPSIWDTCSWTNGFNFSHTWEDISREPQDNFGLWRPYTWGLGGCWKFRKNAKTNIFKEMCLNIILGTHHKYIKNDDFYLIQLLLLAYFDPSNFL